MSKMKQNLGLSQTTKLSPQQIQLMKLLQVPTVMLEQRIQEELDANPALEDTQDELLQDGEVEEEAYSEKEIKEAEEEYEKGDKDEDYE